MAKNLKIKVKNTQIAEALNLGKLKKGLADKKAKPSPKKKAAPKKAETAAEETTPVKKKARIVSPKETQLEVKRAKPKATKKTEQPVVHEVEEPVVPASKILESSAGISKPEKKKVIEEKPPVIIKRKEPKASAPVEEEERPSKKTKGFKEFKEFRSLKKDYKRSFDTRDRMGLREEEEGRWRKARHHQKKKNAFEEQIIRPTHLKVKLPISIKDLAQAMKLKASELISKLFLQGVIVTLNDLLDDETTIQLLGQEFGCEISIDTSEEERLRITDKTIKEEIESTEKTDLQPRRPIIAFMGHVDHGKTSLIDAIRKSNITAQEAGAITQHIGAFKAKTPSGELTILDTPGHEAFSEMRTRGTIVTDIVVLVVAGDEGMREQTIEALNQAKEAKVPIVVAINKSDKNGYDPDKVYRQLADHELLPESWGGTTITVNCSATTKNGIPELLEMLSLQAEVLELKANPTVRARGTVLESQMHKGFGAIATVLIQNGTLRLGDAIVFGQYWGRVKTMHDEKGQPLEKAGPATAVKITGLSDLADAGDEFIVVKNEKEARALADARSEGIQRRSLQQKKRNLEHLLQQAPEKKTLTLILRADVQGSLEALKQSLLKIKSKKIDLSIVSEEVGEVSESDIQLAAAANAVIIGFHTRIESHAEELVRKLKANLRMHDVIYHAIEDVQKLMIEQLDKIPEEKPMGKLEVKTIFKSSQIGKIAGCQVLEGLIRRNDFARIEREGEIVFDGKIASLKREKEDVKEVQKGFECGIVLAGFDDFMEGDIIETHDITYKEQEL